MTRKLIAVVALITLLCPLALFAQTADVDQRIQALQTEIEKLNAEVAALKAPAAAPAAAAAAPGAPAAPAKPDPLAGISSVLSGATVTGLVDGYYGYNINHPDFSQPLGRSTALRLFDARSNQFALNLIEMGVVKAPDADNRLGYKVIFGFGDAMNVVNTVSGGDPTFLQHVKEAYFSYLAPVGKGLQINVGKFVTPNGAEVIETNGNWNYSRSLLFNYAIPFYHYGLSAAYTFNPKVSVTGYVVNGWNDVIHDSSTGYNNSGKTGGVTFVYTATKKLAVTENWMGGPGAVQADGSHWRNLFDTVITYNPTAKLSLMANGDYGRVEGTLAQDLAGVPNKSVEWWGGAGYIKYQFNPKWAVATRYEYYNDPDGYTIGALAFNNSLPNGVGLIGAPGPQHVQEVTATLERRIATHLITRLEYRHDQSNREFFPTGASRFEKGQNTIAAGVVFVLEPQN